MKKLCSKVAHNLFFEILPPYCPELSIWPKIENPCEAFSRNWDLPSFCRLFRAVSGVKLLPSLPRPGKTLNLLIFCASNVSLANPKMNGTISYTSSRKAWVRYRSRFFVHFRIGLVPRQISQGLGSNNLVIFKNVLSSRTVTYFLQALEILFGSGVAYNGIE